jgi:hypothetical protein
MDFLKDAFKGSLTSILVLAGVALMCSGIFGETDRPLYYYSM